MISRSSVVALALSAPSIVIFAPPPVCVSIVISSSTVTAPVMETAPFEFVDIVPFKTVGPVMVISSISVVAPSIAFKVTVPVPEARLVISVTVPSAVP